MEKLNRYRTRLENNPRFRQGTVSAYTGAIQGLLSRYGEDPSIDQLNAFISEKCRKRQPHVKYAIKEMLEMDGREEDYRKLVQAKVRRPVRAKNFLDRDQLINITSSIKKEPYRTIAKLQLATAARATAIITLEKRRVRQEEGRIRLTLMEKGDKPRTVYLREELWGLLAPFHSEPKKYLFLEKEAEGYTDARFFIRARTMLKEYLRFLQDAARECGLNISTHDIRRSVANLITASTNNPRITQKLLDHQSMVTTERYLEDNAAEVSDVLFQHQAGL